MPVTAAGRRPGHVRRRPGPAQQGVRAVVGPISTVAMVEPPVASQPASKQKNLFRSYLLLLAALLGAIVIVGLLLDTLGREFPEHARSSQVWGSVADWAMAILPAVAILSTVDLWSRQNRASADSALEGDLEEVTLERRVGGTWLCNGSRYTVDVLAAKGIDFRCTSFRPGESRLLAASTPEYVDFIAQDRVWRLELGGRSRLRQQSTH